MNHQWSSKHSFVINHRQRNVIINNVCFGILIADKHLLYLQIKHLQCICIFIINSSGYVHVCHLSPSSMDIIHGWGFSIHKWNSWRTFSSTDEVPPSMDDIHRWHFHLWMRLTDPCMELSSIRFCSFFIAILDKIGNLFGQNVMDDNSILGLANPFPGWKCHPWMEKLDL